MDSSGTLVPLVLLVTVLLRCSADTGQHMRHFEAATALLSSGKYAAAISELSAAIKADPTFVQGFFHRGKLRKRLGNFRDSERDFEEVLRLSPSNVIAKQSIQDHKLQSLDAQKMEGRKAYAAADWKKALALLLPVSKEAPLSSDLRYEIAKSYYELGDYPNAFLYSGKHLELTGKSLDGILLRGMSCYHLGNDINAIKHFREGLSLDPENKQLKKPYKKLRKLRRVIDRAEEELSQGKSRKAIRSFREAIELEERVEVLKHLYLNLCRAQTKAKLFNEADKSCSKALEFDDSVVEAWTARGEARLKAEKFQEAVSDYTKAVELDPNNRDIQRSLQNAQLELKKSKRKNYYKILGVTKDASSRELKKAYRKLVKKLHPDKNIGKSDEEVQKAENEFREVNEAYDILVDPEKRKRFDSGEDMEDDGRGGGGHHGFGGFGDFSRGFNPDSGFNFPGGFHFKFG